MSKNFNETVCLQSEKMQEWIREIRGERLQGIVESASSASCLASSSAALFSGRNECPEDPLEPDRTGGERRQFLPNLPESLR